MAETDSPPTLPAGVDVLIEGLNRSKAESLLAKLTMRETEVLVGLAHTKTRKGIAIELKISETRVAQLQAAAKKKLGVTERSEAVAAFVIARQLCDLPIYTEKHLQQAQQTINRMVLDQPIEDVYRRLASKEFREYLADLRSSGPKALTARYGPAWRIGAGAIVALIVFALLLFSITVAQKLDSLFSGMPS